MLYYLIKCQLHLQLTLLIVTDYNWFYKTNIENTTAMNCEYENLLADLKNFVKYPHLQ